MFGRAVNTLNIMMEDGEKKKGRKGREVKGKGGEGKGKRRQTQYQ